MIRITAAPSRTVNEVGIERPHPTMWATETEDGEQILASTRQPFLTTARKLIKQGAAPTRPAPCGRLQRAGAAPGRRSRYPS